MLVAKPIIPGTIAQLDGSGRSTEVQDLATLAGAELIPAVDFGSPALGNPDGAKGKLSKVPGLFGPVK